MVKQLKIVLHSLILGMLVFANSLYAEMLGVTNGDGESGGELVSIDLTTGAATLIGPLPITMTEAVYDSANQLLYAQGSNGSFVMYLIDPTDGTEISQVSTSGAYNGMEFVGGTLYASMITGGGGLSDLVTVDPVTGVATIIGPTGYPGITGLAYDSASSTMYGVVGGGSTSSGSLVTIDMTTGVATMVGPTGFIKVGSIEFGQDGNLYGALTSSDSSAPTSLIMVNTSTGTGTEVGITTYSVTGLAETVLVEDSGGPSIPVPTLSVWALIMFIVLIGMLGFVRLHRRV